LTKHEISFAQLYKRFEVASEEKKYRIFEMVTIIKELTNVG